jgi:hypothetical protein
MATWTISTLEHNTADGGVIVAHWRVNDEETVGEETYSASAYGTVGFTPDADADGFVAYDDLTESAVLAWVHESVDQDATEAALTANIEAQKNPVSADGMPW